MTTDQHPIPGSVFNARQTRTLKMVVVILSILLIIGFAFLIAGLYHQASRLGKDASSAASGAASPAPLVPPAIELGVSPGSKVERVIGEGGRVIVHLRGPGGEEIIVLDPSRSGVLTRLKISPQ